MLDISLPVEHLYSIFIRSIPERRANDRALRLGKAFIIMLFQMSKEVSNHVWKAALQRVKDESKDLIPDVDPDLLFILSIVAKLLSHKLGSTDVGVEFPKACEVSQSLLAWLLQPLENLLRLEYPHPSRFLPEAYRAFLKLEWPEESKSDGVQYFRTFEIYFNIVVGANVEGIDQVDKRNSQDFNQLQIRIDHLKRILEKLKRIDVSRLPDVHQHLIVPMTVLSRLASISYLEQAFNETLINPWMVEAFKEAVRTASEIGVGESMWLFAGCVMKLATALNAFNPIEGPVLPSQTNGDDNRQTSITKFHVDSKSLLSYLLNTQTPAAVTSEQIVYSLEIVHRNVEELPDLTSHPDFINYILYATGPGQVYTIHHIGSKVLVAGCQFLLRTYDSRRLMELADHCDLVGFLRRAILNEDPPTMLQHLLVNSNDDFNTNLLEILSPSLGDPFDTLLTKLNEEPHKIPERDLRDLEIALVLSKDEGRKKLLYDHLDSYIALIALPGFKDTMALPLTVIVGWLLRRDGPLSASEDVCLAFIRPDFEELLFVAWGDLDTLEDNPHMLRLLLNCTGRWLSTYLTSGTGPSPGLSSQSLSTLTRLLRTLGQLLKEGLALSSDIKKALLRLYRQIEQAQGTRVEEA